jgi:O-antigen/teichoic acid export membrane protein
MSVSIREPVLVASSQLIAAVGSLLIFRLINTNLSPYEYGILATLTASSSIATLVFYGGIIASILRFYSLSPSGADFQIVYQQSIRIFFCNTRVLSFCYILAVPFLTIWFGFKISSQACLTLCVAILTSYYSLHLTILTAKRWRLQNTWFTLFDVFIRLSSLYVVFLLPGLTMTGVLASLVFSALISCTYLKHIIVTQLGLRKPPIELARSSKHNYYYLHLRRYASPFACWGLLSWLCVSSERWSLIYFTNPTLVAVYSCLQTLSSSAFGLVTTFLLNYLTPIYFQRISGGDVSPEGENNHGIPLYSSLLMLMLGSTVTMMAYYGSAFVFKVVAPSYVHFSYLLPLSILAAVFVGATNILLDGLLGLLNIRQVAYIRSISSCLGIIANILLVMNYGLIGLLLSLFFVAAISFIVTIFFFLKNTGSRAKLLHKSSLLQ